MNKIDYIKKLGKSLEVRVSMQVKIEGKMDEKGAYRAVMLLNSGIFLFLVLIGIGLMVWLAK